MQNYAARLHAPNLPTTVAGLSSRQTQARQLGHGILAKAAAAQVDARVLHADALADEVLEVEADIGEHAAVLLSALHALGPRGAVAVDGAELPRQDRVEVLDVVLGPLDARRHHRRREARLVRHDRVADDGEVYVGYLVDVVVQVAVEDALSGNRLASSLRIRMNLTNLVRFLMVLLRASR